MKAYKGAGRDEEIPADLKAAAETAHTSLVEAAAEGDDSLLEKYLESGSLSADEIARGLVNVVRARSFIPVFVSAGGASLGIAPLLDAVLSLMPSPLEREPVKVTGKGGEETLKAEDSGPLAAYVWKTTADPFVGKQTYFRIFSGMISSDSRVWNQSKETEERLGAVYIPRGKETLQVKTLHSGDIGVVPKLTVTATGNTLCDKAHPLTLPSHLSEFALVAIFPKTQADSTKSTRLSSSVRGRRPSRHQEAATNQTILQAWSQHRCIRVQNPNCRSV